MNAASIKRPGPAWLRSNGCELRATVPWIIAGTFLAAAFAGCGGPRPVTGGTSGLVTIDEAPVLDMQVVVYSADTGEQVGFGVTDGDGRFQLVSNGATGPVTLDPGRYAATLESVGAPLELPAEYLDPQSTPVQFEWSQGDEIVIDLSGVVDP